MANVISTVITYPLNGSTVDFAIPFEYLARKFVRVTLVGTNRQELVLNQDYRFTTRTQITTTRAWGTGDGYDLIEIRRYTSATDRLVDFADGSILRAYDLNISQVQTLHVAEEARDLTADTIGVNNDGNLDARGRRIVNVADGIDAGDAVTVRQQQAWADSALNQANRAKTEADRAKTEADRAKTEADSSTNQANLSAASAAAALVSEGKAKTSETNAKTYETNADASASQSAVSAAAALVSEDKAKTSETNAKASEDRAILEAGKLGNMNDFAAAIKTVTGNDVVMKGKFSVDNMIVHSNFYVYSGGVKLNSAGTVILGDDGNIVSSIYRDGNIYSDLNKRILQGENRRLVATDIWYGDLTGAGPWNIGPVYNMVGGTLGIKVNKDGEDLWLVLSMSPLNDMKYTLTGRGSLSVDIRIWGGTQIEVTRVTNCNVRQLQLWK